LRNLRSKLIFDFLNALYFIEAESNSANKIREIESVKVDFVRKLFLKVLSIFIDQVFMGRLKIIFTSRKFVKEAGAAA